MGPVRGLDSRRISRGHHGARRPRDRGWSRAGGGGGERATPEILTGTPDAGSQPERSEWRWIASACIAAPLGLLVISIANSLSYRGSSWGVPLFWTGLVLIVGTTAAALWSGKVNRNGSIGILVITGLALYAVKVLHSPAGLGGYDELLHYRTLDDLVRSGRLFGENSLLPISPFYPGLEIVTATLMKVTGVGIFSAALVVIGFARLLMVLAVYLFLERVCQPPRLAALGTLLYMACPSFVFFDAIFAYESLALPLAVFCLFALRAGQANEGGRRTALNVAGAAAGLAVAVTHHVTSFILVGTLVLWALATLAFHRIFPERVPGDGWAPALVVAAVITWAATVAKVVAGYLWPHVISAMSELVRIVSGESTSRRLFESSSGIKSPLLERLVGLGSVALVAACLPFGLWYLWKHQRRQPLAWLMGLGAVAYPVMMLMRFTRHGWAIGSRAMAFVYIPLALVLVCGTEILRASRWGALRKAAVAVPVILVIFAGGVIAGSGPSARLPLPYRAGSGEISIDAETIAAALWAREHLGPNNRIAADSTNASIMGSYGRQRVVTAADGVSITGLFLSPGPGVYQSEIIEKGRIRYVVVDRRIAGVIPLKGFFYESWERDLVDYGATVDAETLGRFDEVEGASRIYDSGNIQIYDLAGVAR